MDFATRPHRLPLVICPTGSLRHIVSSPFCKNILIFRNPNQLYMSCRLVPTTGALAIVTNAGRDAVDAGGATDERIELSWRTAKTCGPDASVLASSRRRQLRRRRWQESRSPGRARYKPARNDGSCGVARCPTLQAVVARLDRLNPPSISRRQRWNREAAAYWMPRWSLSSGSPKARPDGGHDSL
jgi:hypothetical protein